MPIFSVVIPVYNVKEYLMQCIESILAQTFSDYEVVLIDDGSKDGSGEICDQYAKENKNIIVIHQSNKGASGARNTGIQRASGKYLVFVDSDDWLISDALESTRKLIIASDAPDVVINRFKAYYETKNELVECQYFFNESNFNPYDASSVFKECYGMRGFWGAPWSFTVKKSYLEDNNLYFLQGIMQEDEEWAPRLLLNASTFAFNNICTYCLRSGRVGSVSNTKNIEKEIDKWKIILMINKESKKIQYNASKKKMLRSRCSALYIGLLSSIYFYKNDGGNKYILLVNKLNRYKCILLFSKKIKHILVYVLCNLFGIDFVSKVLYIISKR